MEILVLGLNHKTAPVELREKLSVPPHRTPDILKALKIRKIFDERLVLSTCNRTEIYGVGYASSESVHRTKEFLSEYAGMNLSTFEDKLYILRQPDSIRHLFLVAAGLDSMVIGETEITGQVKDAYEQAHAYSQTGKVLNTLFQRSFKVAKNIRTQTGIGTKNVSIASVTVDLAGKIFGKLGGARVMVIGTGQMATQITRAMVQKGALPMIVSSHHLERAEMLAQELGGKAVPFHLYEDLIQEVDILIASTQAPRGACLPAGRLIHENQVKGWMRRRHEKPLFMVDLAVPRNLEVSIDKLDNVYLYNVDDLQSIAGQNLAFRESQLNDGLNLVQIQTHTFMRWLSKEFPPTSSYARLRRASEDFGGQVA